MKAINKYLNKIKSFIKNHSNAIGCTGIFFGFFFFVWGVIAFIGWLVGMFY